MSSSTFKTDNLSTQASDTVNRLADTADSAVKSTRRVANTALDSAESAIGEARDTAEPTIARLAGQAEALAKRGVDAVKDTASQVRERAASVGDATVRYVRDEPVKSVLIAAATGAALMGLLALIQSARRNNQ
ncbi:MULTISPECIES: DUF883 family protein [unclassified Rhizobacter]|uniref:DUF883 family protein n=1 Tax=unclassified Rhizobacter TaxID=2640088 RepID=UPI000701A66B|nr:MULTISPECIES: DUF883 family protein [unclassified Rhizobacter]KQU71218.1 hypothetical protein ASC88_05505 [Rhizobacter sp. Root29]KQV97097.1 hypothetical protein ASC98_13275 [Rhizobacter sp. Root1238]KRB24169.1 hypothetical protein ASE08_19175 [Rhizobacter sp. Root16D2]